MVTTEKKSASRKKSPQVEAERPKSRVTLYWEDRRRRGIPPGEILNMRAVLK
jgi:hypothetical protein